MTRKFSAGCIIYLTRLSVVVFKFSIARNFWMVFMDIVSRIAILVFKLKVSRFLYRGFHFLMPRMRFWCSILLCLELAFGILNIVPRNLFVVFIVLVSRRFPLGFSMNLSRSVVLDFIPFVSRI